MPEPKPFRERLKDYSTMFAISFLGAMFTFVMFALIMLSLGDISLFSKADFMINYREDNVTQSIVNLCSLEEGRARIGCAMNLVSRFYKYNVSDKVRPANQVFREGGDCADYSYLYMDLFKNLGFEANFVTTKDHIYVVVYGDDFYCNVDQTKYDCHILG